MIQLSKTSLFLFLCGIHLSSFAQQVPYYSAIRENWGLLNPAFLDFHYYDFVKNKADRPDLFISGALRHQYLKKNIGISNANFRVECYECLFDRVKLSGGIILDKIGSFQEAGGYGQFGWSIIKDKLMLAYGIKLNNQWLNIQSDDFADFANDPSAQNAVGINSHFNAYSDLGFSYITKLDQKKYHYIYFGMGLTQLWSDRFRTNLELRKTPQWNGFLGALIRQKKNATRMIQWEPVVLIKYIPEAEYYWFRGTNAKKPFMVDWSIRMSNIRHLERVGDYRLGLSGSTDGSINAEIGLVFNKRDLFIFSPTILPLSQSHALGIELAYTHSWTDLFGGK